MAVQTFKDTHFPGTIKKPLSGIRTRASCWQGDQSRPAVRKSGQALSMIMAEAPPPPLQMAAIP